MGTVTESICFRCRSDCTPLANLGSDAPSKSAPSAPVSFICVGVNHPASRSVPQDRFTLCWKNRAVEERGHWDKRDLLDTMSVIAQALSIDENIRASNGFSESDMQQVNFLS